MLWAEVKPNELVYIQSGDGKALGPQVIVDPTAKTLRTFTGGQTHTCDSEILLYKKGPFVVFCMLNGQFNAVYTDIPMEIVAARMDDAGPRLFTSNMHRPRPLDQLPSDFKRVLDRETPEGWPELYGKYDLVEAAAVDENEEDEALLDLTISNRLAANALAVELIRLNLDFFVDAEAQHVVFSVSKSVFDQITQHLKGLAEGVIDSVEDA